MTTTTTTTTDPQQFAQSGTLDELYGKLSPVMMVPGWAKTAPSLWPEPKSRSRRTAGPTTRPRARSTPPAG